MLVNREFRRRRLSNYYNIIASQHNKMEPKIIKKKKRVENRFHGDGQLKYFMSFDKPHIKINNTI